MFWNYQAESILGYDAQRVLGRKCYEVVRGLSVDGITHFCGRNCPVLAAAKRGQIPPVAYVRMQCASGHTKQVTMIPLIVTDAADRAVLVHMFHESPPDEPASGILPELPLTSRELEVFRMLAAGLRPAQIAQELFISVHTVRKHISNASEKLHSHGMMSAVLAAKRRT